MKTLLNFYRNYKKGFLASVIFFVTALVVGLSCGLTLSKPLTTASSVTPRNSGKWTDEGNYAESFSGGSGSLEDPYLISNGAELAKLAVDVNSGNTYEGNHFKVVEDIDLLDYYWTPIGPSVSVYFSGSFNGDYNKISGLIIDGDYAFGGLFGVTRSQYIKNIKIDDCSINLTPSAKITYTGMLVGYLWGASAGSFVENCSASGSIDGVYSSTSLLSVGGLIGSLSKTSISECSTDGLINVTGSECSEVQISGLVGLSGNGGSINDCYSKVDCTISGIQNGCAGGIIGRVSGTSTVKHCYFAGSIESAEIGAVGGIIGLCNASGSTISNSFNLGSVSSAAGSYIGGILGRDNGTTATISNCYYDTDTITTGVVVGGGTPTVTSSGGASFLDEITQRSGVYHVGYSFSHTNDAGETYTGGWSESWDFGSTWTINSDVNDGYPIIGINQFKDSHWIYNAADSFESGEGTQENPYIIATAEQLAKLSADVAGGEHYTDQYFKLKNNIDLDGKQWNTIGDATAPSHTSYFAGSFDGAGFEILNLQSNDGTLPHGALFGVIEYDGEGKITIENLGIQIDITVGAALAFNIETTRESTGQIFVKNCFSYGRNSYGGAGLIWGAYTANNDRVQIFIEDCYSSVDIIRDKNLVSLIEGGDVGSAGIILVPQRVSMKNCYFDGEIDIELPEESLAMVGGLVGLIGVDSNRYALIENCYNAGNINVSIASSDMGCIGGLVGGILGSNGKDTVITNCYNIGDISVKVRTASTQAYVGGFAGMVGGTIENCFAINNISIDNSVGGTVSKGGFSGINYDGKIKNCYHDSKMAEVFNASNMGSNGVIANSGMVENLGLLMKKASNYSTDAFGIYTDENQQVGSAYWSTPWLMGAVWRINEYINKGYPTLYLLKYYWTDEGKYAEEFADGDGSIDNPYIISNGAEFAKLAVDVNLGETYANKYFELSGDIDLSEYLWVPIGGMMLPGDDGSGMPSSFGGNFDGKNFTISGMTLYGTPDMTNNMMYVYSGLFGGIINLSQEEIQFKNIKFVDYIINIYDAPICYAGAFVSMAMDAGGGIKISNVHTDGNLILKGSLSGAELGAAGLVGMTNGKVETDNCSASGNISVQGDKSGRVVAGGLIAETSEGFVLENSNSSVNINVRKAGEHSYAGGLIAGGYGTTITNSFNTGIINASFEGDSLIEAYAGGIIGYLYSGEHIIENSYNAGDITVDFTTSLETSVEGSLRLYVGGLYGVFERRGGDDIAIVSCYNTGNINATAHSNVADGVLIFAGGLAGRDIDLSGVTVTNAYGNSSTYGDTGTGDITVSNSFNSGKITASSSREDGNGGGIILIGGLFGEIIGKADGREAIIENSYNSGAMQLGTTAGAYFGLAGTSANAEFTKCYNSGAIIADDYYFAGGIIGVAGAGYANVVCGDVTLTDCFAVGAVPSSGTQYFLGGIIGGAIGNDADPSVISVNNCYYYHENNMTGLYAMAQDGYATLSTTNSGYIQDIKNVLRKAESFGVTDSTTGFASYTDSEGTTGNAFWTSAWDFDTLWAIDVTVNRGYPTFKSFISDSLWSQHASDGFNGGAGTQEDPYQIATAEQLSRLAVNVNAGTDYSGEYFVLTNDIDLSKYLWVPIGLPLFPNDCIPDSYETQSVHNLFAGNFDGQNHVITGMSMYGDYNSMGMFGFVMNKGNPVEIKNLGLENAKIEIDPSAEYGGDAHIGSLIALAMFRISTSSDTMISVTNCYSDAQILDRTDVRPIVGGIVGYAMATFAMEDYPLLESAGSDMSAILSANWFKVKDSYFSGKITSNSSVSSGGLGGIFGQGMCVTLENCYNTGAIDRSCEYRSSAGGCYVGGLAGGLMMAKIDDCYNKGALVSYPHSSSFTCGGLAGTAGYTEIINSQNLANIVIGKGSGYVGQAYIGGLIGSESEGENSIINSYNQGDINVTASSVYAGGISGKSRGTTEYIDCYNSGDINTVTYVNLNYSRDHYIGGLVGFIGGSSSDYTMEINGCANVGNIVADNTAETTGPYTNYIGGLVGYIGNGDASTSLTISQSFADCNIATSFGYNGGLVGYLNNSNHTLTISEAFYEGNQTTTGAGKGNTFTLVAYQYANEASSASDVYSLGKIYGVEDSNSSRQGPMINFAEETQVFNMVNVYFSCELKISKDTVDGEVTTTIMKCYVGEFSAEKWFFDSRYSDGNLRLKNLYILKDHFNTTTEQNLAQLQALGYIDPSAA